MTPEEQKQYLEELKIYVDKLEKNCFYTIQRIDILAILLSTSGIILLTNLIDTLSKNGIKDFTFLKLAVTLFALTIIINLLSQLFAYLSNYMLMRFYHKKIDKLKEDENYNHKKDSKKTKYATILGHSVSVLNYISIATLIVGIIVALAVFWGL